MFNNSIFIFFKNSDNFSKRKRLVKSNFFIVFMPSVILASLVVYGQQRHRICEGTPFFSGLLFWCELLFLFGGLLEILSDSLRLKREVINYC